MLALSLIHNFTTKPKEYNWTTRLKLLAEIVQLKPKFPMRIPKA